MATATKNKLMKWDPTDVKAELIKKYPPKVARKRAKQIMINEAQQNDNPTLTANVRTIPGIITMRGCTYAGCKGVIMGPTRDIVNITHGPIGCGFYSWLTRRNQPHFTRDKRALHSIFTVCSRASSAVLFSLPDIRMCERTD